MPERELWLAVIDQAIKELGKVGSTGTLARAWFFRESPQMRADFKMVCDLAGFDYEYVQRLATRFCARRGIAIRHEDIHGPEIVEVVEEEDEIEDEIEDGP